MNTFSIIGLVFLGGGIGSLCRFGIGKLSLKMFTTDFPIGTLLANTFACLILGILLFSLKDKVEESDWIKYLIVIGFCGGFSTFSTFSAETVKLFQDGLFLFGILNVLISLLLGIGILLALIR